MGRAEVAAVAEEMAVAVGGVAPRVEVAAVVVGAPLARTRPARHRQPKAKQEEEEHAALERGVNTRRDVCAQRLSPYQW